MDTLNEKNAAELQGRVKANIYKVLLKEEVHKNKRNRIVGISIFVVGIVSTSALHQMNYFTKKQNLNLTQNTKQYVPISNISNYQNNSVPKYLIGNNSAEMDILDDKALKNTNLSNIKEDDFFVSDFKM